MKLMLMLWIAGCAGSVEIGDDHELFGEERSDDLPDCAPCGACLCDATAERTYRCSSSDEALRDGCWTDGSLFNDAAGLYVCVYCD